MLENEGTNQADEILEEDEADETGSEPEELTQEGDVFYDATKVPTELKATYLDMQRRFTQKTQNLSESKQKAELFDQLLQDEEAIAALRELHQRRQGGVSEEEDEDSGDVASVVRQEVSPLQQKIRMMEVQREKEIFERAHPDWRKEVGEDAMKAVWRENPYLSMEHAYRLARYDTDQTRKVNSSKTVERRGVSRGANTRVKVDSWEDAVRAAHSKLSLSE